MPHPWALTHSGFSQWPVVAMAAVPGGKGGFRAITAFAFVTLSCVLEGFRATVLFDPLLFPVPKTMCMHDVHYALVIILAMGIGLFARNSAWGSTARARSGGCRRTTRSGGFGRIWPAW
jgi:TRAP-type C4-dicarboxylate transport system permease large subunit